MAYFSNSSEGDYYYARYCEQCVHNDLETGCPVWQLHFMWNYDAVGDNADETKAEALDSLWPRNKDDCHNGDCLMFHSNQTDTADDLDEEPFDMDERDGGIYG